MQEKDKIAFAASMAEMGVAFGRNINKEMLAVYFKHLSKQTIHQVTTAIDEIIAKDERFPTLSRVKAMANVQRKHPRPPMQDVPQIEEVALPNDLPRTKEAFFQAMEKLLGDADISGEDTDTSISDYK